MAGPHPEIRKSIKTGMIVSIAIDEEDTESHWKRGSVEHIITPNEHMHEPRGIEVRINDGTIGRIKEIHESSDISNDKILDLINNGESNEIEFKETFKIDIKTNQKLDCLRNEVVKAMAALMNTDGGFLFIGIDDSGKIVGLERDYQHVSLKHLKQTKHDKLIQEISNYTQNCLKDKTLASYYKIMIKKIKEKDICVIQINRANEKVFVEQNITYIKCENNNKVAGSRAIFYMRNNASSIEVDPRDIDKHLKNKTLKHS